MFKKAISLTLALFGLLFNQAQAHDEKKPEDGKIIYYAEYDYLIEDCFRNIINHAQSAIVNKDYAALAALNIEEELSYAKSWILRKSENAQLDQ